MITLMTQRQRSPAAGVPWVYLGQDYLALRRLERDLGADRRIPLAPKIEAIASEMADDFVAWVSAQGSKQGFSLAWWMTNLAGHSVSTSLLYLDLCHLHALEQVLSRFGESRLLVVCDDWFLLRTVERNFLRRGRNCCRSAGWRSRMVVDATWLSVRWAARWVHGVGSLLHWLWAAARSRPRRSMAKPETSGLGTALLLTCVEESALGADGVFRDRYFPGLAEALSDQGYRVTTIPWLFQLQRSRRAAFEWFRNRTDDRFLLLEDHTRWWDLLPAAWTVLKSALFLRGADYFRNWDIGPLLERERIKDSSSCGRMRFLLYLPALCRWAAAGGRCDVFIQTFENMPNERPALAAFRQFAPGVPVFGYQHIGGLARGAISYRITTAEWAGGGFPDYIIANSRESAAQLRAQGFPFEAVRAGPALRYRYLQEPLPDVVSPSGRNILVLLPLETPSAVELLVLVLEQRAAIYACGLGIVLKAHPMASQDALWAAAGGASWPEDWQWVVGSVQDHIGQAAVVIGQGSSLLDAAASAVPFLSLRRECGLTLNPLVAWIEEFPWCANIARAEFMFRVQGLLAADAIDREERLKLAHRIRSGLGSCSPLDFHVFLPQKPSTNRKIIH